VLRWVFLDIGNVLMNDDPAMALLYRELHRALCAHGYRFSFRDLLAEREELIRTRGPEHWAVLGRKYLGEEGHYRLMHRCASQMRADYMASHSLIPGMVEVVLRLADRFAIGVIANQLKEVSDALDQVGLGAYIRVRAISEAVGIRKPDPKLYLWALDRAGCAANEAVMIGDRADNDIAPARAVGMWTILCRIPHESKAYRPRGEYETLYFESQGRESISRIPPAGPEETPDAVADSVEGLMGAIDGIARRAMSSSEELPSRR
jgi:HAD superfamily hydrolase (TIGR01549 family)